MSSQGREGWAASACTAASCSLNTTWQGGGGGGAHDINFTCTWGVHVQGTIHALLLGIYFGAKIKFTIVIRHTVEPQLRTLQIKGTF